MMDSEMFLMAITSGDREGVRAALASNPERVNARTSSGLPAVIVALYYQEPEIAEMLASAGADLDIFSAAALGRADFVARLLEEDPSRLDSFASDGFQAVHLAAFFGQTGVMEALLARGAEVNTPAQNPMRVQPLHSAAAGQHLEIARLLLEHGADAGALQAEGFAPLHSAAQNGQMDMVELLLAYGAGPDQKTDQGQTPAEIAEQSGYPQVAARLRQAGG